MPGIYQIEKEIELYRRNTSPLRKCRYMSVLFKISFFVFILTFCSSLLELLLWVV